MGETKKHFKIKSYGMPYGFPRQIQTQKEIK